MLFFLSFYDLSARLISILKQEFKTLTGTGQMKRFQLCQSGRSDLTGSRTMLRSGKTD